MSNHIYQTKLNCLSEYGARKLWKIVYLYFRLLEIKALSWKSMLYDIQSLSQIKFVRGGGGTVNHTLI